MSTSRRGGKRGKSSISFSIAGIRATSKPQTQALVPPLPAIFTSPAVAASSSVVVAASDAAVATAAALTPRQKYPGRGKLTIVKKHIGKGKSDIRRVPITDTSYDSSDDDDDDNRSNTSDSVILPLLLQDEESILLDKVDAEITRAEEKELLARLDDEILAAEEAELMQWLLLDIKHAEFLEKCDAKPSVVMQYPDVEELLMKTPNLPSLSTPATRSRMEFVPTLGSQLASEGIVQDIVLREFAHVTKSIPKYVDQEHKILAYTILEFHTGVIAVVEHEVRQRDPFLLQGFDARLKPRDPSDPFSYLLEAHGPIEMLDMLRERTEMWIRHRINTINCWLLLQDGKSVVLDVFVTTKVDKLCIQVLKTDFETEVIEYVENNLPPTKQARKGHAKIVEWKERPNPCMVEVSGTKDVLESFKTRTQQWVTDNAGYVDDISMRVEMLSNSKLGISFVFKEYAPLGYKNLFKTVDKHTPLRYKKVGVWLADVKAKTSLATAIGGTDIFNYGCSILAVNGKSCDTPNELQKLYLQARDFKGVKLTLCLSKYATFSTIPDLQLATARRLDGKLFDEDEYKQYTLEKLHPVEFVAERCQAPSYLEYPPAGSPTPPPLPRKQPMKPAEKDAAILKLLADENSVEVDLELFASKPLGATCYQSPFNAATSSPCNAAAGLWLHDCKDGGQLIRALGKNACTHGMAIFKANGMTIQPVKNQDGTLLNSLGVFSRIKENAGGRSGTFRITLVMYDGTDLSGVDRSKLVQGRVNPRRRNGKPYPLHLYPLEEDSSSNVSESKSEEEDGGAVAVTADGNSKGRKKTDGDAATRKKIQNKEKPSTAVQSNKTKGKKKVGTDDKAVETTQSKNAVNDEVDGVAPAVVSNEEPQGRKASISARKKDTSQGKTGKAAQTKESKRRASEEVAQATTGKSDDAPSIVASTKSKRVAEDPLDDSDNDAAKSSRKRMRKTIAKKKSTSTKDHLGEASGVASLPPREGMAMTIPRKKRLSHGNDFRAAPIPKKAKTAPIPRKTKPRENVTEGTGIPRDAYTEFADARREDVKARFPGTETEIRLKTMWKNAPEEIKEIYRAKEVASKKNLQTEVEETNASSFGGGPPPPPPSLTASTETQESHAATNSGIVREQTNQPQSLHRGKKVLAYRNFKEDYKGLVDIEYCSRATINPQRVFSVMWAKHKRLMGEEAECDSTCTCFTKIQEMTDQVIENYVTHKKARNEFVESVVALKAQAPGFINHFIPRFYDLLTNQYPGEQPKQLMQRLIKMWPAHQKQRIYGVQCGESCECLDGWEIVFGKGDPATITRNMKERRGSAFGHYKEFPKAPQSAAVGTSEASGPASALRPPGLDKTQQGSSREQTRLKQYEVAFEPHLEPMGAFFVTDHGKCKVASLYKNGKARRDSRIQPGTVVVATRFGEREHAISRHDDLKAAYFKARSTKATLHVKFVNLEVASTHPFDADFDKDWNEYGRWNNRLENGWAGGAKTKEGIAALQKSVQANRNANHNRMDDIQESNDTDVAATIAVETNVNYEESMESTAAETAKVNWISESTKIQPRHRMPSTSLVSIRKEKSVPRDKGKSVTFGSSETTKHFVPGTAAAEWALPSHSSVSHSRSTVRRQVERKLSPRDAVKEAVHRNPYHKLIQVLEEGASTDFDVLSVTLREQHEFVKVSLTMLLPLFALTVLNHSMHRWHSQSSLKAVRDNLKKSPSNSKLREQEKDLTAKRIILNIYINACHQIEQAMTLQHISNFEIKIKSIELHKKPNSETIGRTNLLTGRVTLKRGFKNDELGSLPQRRTTEFVNYDDDSEEKTFMASNNSSRTLEKRSLLVTLREGAQEDAVPPAKLGTVSIPLNDIEEHCSVDEPYTLHQEITPGCSALSKGTIEIVFNRRRIDKDYIMREKEALIKHMHEQIDFIQRFNKEHGGEDTKCKLTANIRSTANSSFLHAAIILHEEWMVKRLLELDANPQEKSTEYGTPINMVMTFRDRVREKLQRHIIGSQPDSVTGPQHDLHDLFSRILTLLKRESSDQLPDDIARSMEEDEEVNDPLLTSAENQEQLQRAFETLKEIFEGAPATAGGTDEGLEANKAYVGSCLRLHYKEQCPTKEAMRAFLEKAIAKKLVVPISKMKLKLGDFGNDSKMAPSIIEIPDPPLPDTQRNWLYNGRLCRSFRKNNSCRYGNRCNFVHAYNLPSKSKWRKTVLEAPDLLTSPLYKVGIDEESLKTLQVGEWYTAGYFNKKTHVYFFAEGKNGKPNRHGVYLYVQLLLTWAICFVYSAHRVLNLTFLMTAFGHLQKQQTP
eukprot:scaffold6219_cov146-Cylindrotheca_fusiformis.AAC.11